MSNRIWTILICFLLSVSLLPSCSSEKQQVTQSPPSQTPPKVSSVLPKLEIQPIEATKEATFYINSKDLDILKTKFQWYVNGKPVEGETSDYFRPPHGRRGDTVQLRASIGGREIVSNLVTIKNIPPAIVRAKLVPLNPKWDDTLKVDIMGDDRDNDRVSFIYEWSRNDKSAGSGESLEGPFQSGEIISVKITPYDGFDHGQPVILTTNIYNSPPVPLKDGIEKFENNVYSYEVRAIDPDGDVLAYNLKQSPKGMVINKNTGLITWTVSEKDSGKYPVTVEITDGRGGKVLYNFDVTVGFEEYK